MVATVSPPDKTKWSCCSVGFSKREWLMVAGLTSVSFCSGVCVSVQGPIYPPEAEEKGANATEYGMVFGIYALVSFFICPVYGKYMDRIGANCLVNCGMAVAGLCSIGFGLLDWIDSHWLFMTASFILRILESLGSSASFTASFAIAAVIFPKTTATIYSLLECCFGLGFALGPTVGAYFFEIGGFVLPFLVVGCVLLLDAIFLFFILPNIDDENNKDRPPVGILTILKMLPVVLDFCSVLAANISVGLNLAILEPHLRQFDISNEAVGAIFAISAATYLLSTPLVGRLCDSRTNPKKIIIAGTLIIITSLSLIGPLPFIPIEPSLWMVYVGLTLHGIGLSCLIVPGFISAIKSAVRCGLPDDITTYSVVTGVSTSSMNLGAFIGPSIAGVLFDLGGYRQSTLFVITVHAVLMVSMVLFVLTDKPDEDFTETSEAKPPNKMAECDSNI